MNGHTLTDFDGETWVAYSDLSGTKARYRESPPLAAEALNYFYNAVYDVQHDPGDITALAVSDCAIFWAHDERGPNGNRRMLEDLLARLQRLHRKMVEHDYLLRTTVAYGHFRYQQRIEIPGLRKDMIIGGAYLDAYATNDKVVHGAIGIIQPEVDPGQPGPVRDIRANAGRFDGFLHGSPHSAILEFVWWVDSPAQIQEEVNLRAIEQKKAPFLALARVYRNATGVDLSPTPRPRRP